MENLTGGTPPVRYLPCVVPCKLYFGIMKTTQNNQSPETWSKIPLQDFTNKSDINWSKSIPEIDQQLYKKYNLSDKEINFIEEKVKAME